MPLGVKLVDLGAELLEGLESPALAVQVYALTELKHKLVEEF